MYAYMFIREIDTLYGAVTVNIVLNFLLKGVYSKRKRFAPKGIKVFSEMNQFKRGLLCRKANW